MFNVATYQSNVAEFAIVHLPKRFHRRATVQIHGECMNPDPEPALKSAGIEGNGRPGFGLGHRRHISSPVGLDGKAMPLAPTLVPSGGALLSDCLHSPQYNLRLDRFKMIRYIPRCK
jgi:hypothetical protein